MLRKNFAWTLAGNATYAACQWGILVILAKLLPPESVGRFAYGLAVTAPVFMFTNLSLRAVYVTDVRGEFPFGQVQGLRLWLSALGLAVVFMTTLGLPNSPGFVAVVVLIGLSKAVESISDIRHAALQKIERMDFIAGSLILRGASSLVGVGIAAYVSQSVAWAALAMVGCWLAVLVAYDIPIARRALPSPERQRATLPGVSGWRLKTRLAWIALPLGIVMALISLNANVPRYFIEHLFGERSLAIYVAMSYLTVAGTMIINAVGQSATPRLARQYEGGESASFMQLLVKLMTVAGAAGAGLVIVSFLFGRPLLAILYSSEYSEQPHVLVWIMAAGSVGFLASILGYGMTACRRFRVQVPLYGAMTAATALGCMVLVPKFGLSGAAWAELLAAGIGLFGAAVVVLRAFRK